MRCLLGYQARLAALHASASQLRTGQMISLTLVSLAIVAILSIAFFSLTRRNVSLHYSFLPLPFVAYFGLVGKRHNSTLLRALRLERYYQQGIARLEGQ
jgi:hypothetical protein